MVTRAGWQAEEGLRRAAPLYTTAVKVVFVHHTDTTNDYTCRDSAAIVRGIYAYHVLSLGWNDIGYNFLVDRCGTLFEGRYGGADRPVAGAHVLGFNNDSAGVALIGTHTTTGASPAALATVAQLAAWKLCLDAIAPWATSTLQGTADIVGGGTARTFAAISGHRDGFATTCPGDAVYTQLPQLRTAAAQDPHAAALTVSVVAGATSVAARYYTSGSLTLAWTTTVPAAVLAGFSVQVDGQTITTAAPTTRSAALTLTPGTHTLTVQTVYPAGATSTVLKAVAVVTCDTTAPTLTTTPTLGLLVGTVNSNDAPVTLTWHATDDSPLASVAVTSPTAVTLDAATTSWNTRVRFGTNPFTLIVTDAAGNARTTTINGTLTWVPDHLAHRTGPWTRVTGKNYLDGAALTSAHANSSLTWSFTGQSVAWIATRSPTSGQAKIYLDGIWQSTLDLGAAHTDRQAVWIRNGLAPTTHTLKIVVVGTARRPNITTNGILSLAQS